jgi:NADH pyrophosphatase NudC (nudix superfamily)
MGNLRICKKDLQIRICKKCGEEMFLYPTGFAWQCPSGHSENVQRYLKLETQKRQNENKN